MKKYLIVILFVIPAGIFAQTDVEIKSHFSALRQGIHDGNTSFLRNSAGYAGSLKEIALYFSDSSAIVRKEAFYLTRVIGEKTDDRSLRRQVTLSLSRALWDKDPSIVTEAAQGLTRFRKEDFGRETKGNIVRRIETPGVAWGEVILLAGFLNLQDAGEEISEKLASGRLKGMDEWNVRLSLARMGDREQIAFCVKKLKSMPLNSRSLPSVVSCLVYIRQKASIEYVFEIINSDADNCSSSNPDNPVSVPCAYKALKYLVGAVKDYPIRADRYGEVEIEDYERALKEVREWYKRQNNKVEIIKDTY